MTTYADYGQELSDAWRTHQAPRTPDAPTVVSLFAGAGGSSLGYSMAGFRELLAVEWDAHAADCLRRNFPGVPVHQGDVAAVDPAAIDLPPSGLDVLDGSPPCQGLSVIGSRRLNDPRNSLFRQYVRLLRAWQPRALVMENVPGLTTGKMRPLFGEVLAELRDAGYTITVRELVASYYGVPQRRKRIIFVGTRTDLGVAPSHPQPTSRQLTFAEAVAGLGNDVGLHRQPTGTYKMLMSHLLPGDNGGDALQRAGRKASFYAIVRLQTNQPAPTILKDSGAHFVHPTKHRLLGTRELSRLCSFPDEYNWGSSEYRQIQARLGNSVPPLLMRAIARHLRTTVLDGVS